MMPTFEKAISRLSLGTGGVATSPLADAMNPLKSVTPEYGKMMELSVARIYRDFISLVAKGRKMDEQKVAALAQGRVFTGRQAIDMGLADTLPASHTPLIPPIRFRSFWLMQIHPTR